MSQEIIAGYVLTTVGDTVSATMSVNTADVPYNSLVYGKTVSINDVLIVTKTTDRRAGGAGEITSVDTLGVPTMTGAHGTHLCTINLDGAGNETVKYEHINVSAIESAFTLPPQLANGRTDLNNMVPQATDRLIYVDSVAGNNATAGPNGDGTDAYTSATIPGTHWRTDPGAVAAYKDHDYAWALWRNGEGDRIIIKRGSVLTKTAAWGGFTLGAGASSTYPHIVCDYGSGALPVLRSHPDVGPGATQFGASTDDNYNHFYNIDFWEQYRDPDHADFIGFGRTEFAINALNFYPGFNATNELDGNHVEGCLFRFTEPIVGNSNKISRAVFRFCAFWNMYSEAEQNSGFFASIGTVLMEHNLHYRGGWLIERDTSTYPAANVQDTHTGGDSTTFTGSVGGLFDSKMDNAVARLNGTSTYIKVTYVGASTLTAIYSTTGAAVTFTSGDLVQIRGERMRGQRNGENHNSYMSNCPSSIYRNNLYLEAAGAGQKLTGYPKLTSDTQIDAVHDGSDGGTTFQDTGAAFGATDALVGAPILRTTGTDRYGIVTENTGITFKAYYTLTDEDALFGTSTGTVYMTFATSDDVTILDPPPFEETCPDVCIYDNYYAGNPTDVSADLNLEDRDWQTRFPRMRFQRNACTKTGYLPGTANGISLWFRWLEDASISGNVIAKISPTGSSYASVFAKMNINNAINDNVFFDIGESSGTNVNGPGALAINSGPYEHSSYQVVYNDIQMQNTDHQVIGDWDSDASASSTWEGNRYYSTRSTATWFEVDNVAGNITTWVAETGETEYTTTAITYINEQTHEDYMTDIGEGTTTITRLADLALLEYEAGTRDENLEPYNIAGSFRLGYRE